MTPPSSETPADFKRALQAAVHRRGLNQADIKRLTKLSNDTVHKAFNVAWKPLPSKRTVTKIVAAFGGDPAAWLRRLDEVVAEPQVPDPDNAAEVAAFAPSAPQPDVERPPQREALHVAGEALSGAAAPRLVDAHAEPAPDVVRPSVGEPLIAPDPVTASGEMPPLRPDASALGDPTPGSGSTTESRRRRWVLPLAIGVGLAVVAAGAVILGNGPDDDLFEQTVISSNAARTFADPLNGIGEGPSIDANTTVLVSCRMFSDVFASVPDGWYYRIESSPWNGRYYAPANSFLNGDPPDDRSQWVTPTDLNVPVC